MINLGYDWLLSQRGALDAERADLPRDVLALRLRDEVRHEFVDALAGLLRHQVADLLGHVDRVLDCLQRGARILALSFTLPLHFRFTYL